VIEFSFITTERIGDNIQFIQMSTKTRFDKLEKKKEISGVDGEFGDTSAYHLIEIIQPNHWC
jgi:hypothetical protein